MSKASDVHWGRQGGRNVPVDDLRSGLEQLAELRDELGGSLRPEPECDGQLGLFDEFDES